MPAPSAADALPVCLRIRIRGGIKIMIKIEIEIRIRSGLVSR